MFGADVIAKRRGYALMAIAAGLAAVGWWTADSPAPGTPPARDSSPASKTVSGSGGGDTRAPLPSETARARLERAERDPFAAALPPPVVDTRPSQPTPAVVSTPPPVPQAPPLSLQFAGRVVGPDGQQTIYVSQNAGPSQTISIGQTLSNGYQVEAISQSAIELRYAPLNTTARLDLPPPPRHEIR